MNLITDPWIPVVRKNGTLDSIRPWQIVERENPVMEIKAPRPDFQGALYQFLIGLLQTCFPPEDGEEWLEFWKEMPEEDKLQNTFAKVQGAFELENSNGAAFLQDFELQSAKPEKIELLLIGAPGANTNKKNIDFFQKRNRVEQLCESCAAVAILTLQLNGPPGGAGHMAGLRGNGPVSTLVKCLEMTSILFKTLWLNVIPYEDDYDFAELCKASVFPWLDRTKTSESCTTKKCKTGCNKCGTFPTDVNFLHRYWSMPRRIRFEPITIESECDICGKTTQKIYREFKTRPNGFRYVGGWEHPLTPYQKTMETLPNPLKGKKASGSYAHWIGLVLQDLETNNHAAKVVHHYLEEKIFLIEKKQAIGLWCFGFDMEPGQAKSRCWYDQQLPLFHLNKKQRANLIDWAGEFIQAAKSVVSILRGTVKAAWFKRPKDAKGDMSMIDTEFWHGTEQDFYHLLHKLAELPGESRMAPPDIYQQWFKTMEKHVFQIFERATLCSAPEDLDLKRIILAKQTLKKNFYGNKEVKKLRIRASEEADK